jgi:hypothetical protein
MASLGLHCQQDPGDLTSSSWLQKDEFGKAKKRTTSIICLASSDLIHTSLMCQLSEGYGLP